MAHHQSNTRKLVPTASEQQYLRHFNGQQDESGINNSTVAGSTPRANSVDERLGVLDSAMSQDSRPNNLDYKARRGNVPIPAELSAAARHTKMHNEERERRENNVASGTVRSQVADKRVAGVVSETQQQTGQRKPGPLAAGNDRTNQSKLPANIRHQLPQSEMDDVSSDSRRNNVPRMAANNHADSLYPVRGAHDNASVDGDTVASSVATDDHLEQNSVVERLMKIREYMHQATTMLDTLRNSHDSGAVDLRKRLEDMLTQLRTEERQYLMILRSLLATHDPHHSSMNGSVSLSGDNADDGMDSDVDRERRQASKLKQNNHMDAAAEQKRLLQEILQQREKMKELLNRQEQLSLRQRESERRLNEGHTASGSLAGVRQSPQKVNTDRRALLEPAGAVGGQSSTCDEVDDDGGDTSTIAESTTSVHEQHHLENRLKELLAKKRGLDELLAELQQFKTGREPLNNSTKTDQLNESMRATTSLSSTAEQTATDAEHVLKIMENNRKIKRLQELQEKLEELRQLSNSYPTLTTSGLEKPRSTMDREISPAGTRLRDAQGLCDERAPSLPRGSSERTFGSADSSNAAPPAVRKQQPGFRDERLVPPAQQQQRNGVQIDEPSSVPLTPDIDELEQLRNRMLSMLPRRGEESDSSSDDADDDNQWKDSDEIQEKVRQLRAAKERLRQLQELVQQVSAIPGLASALPDDVSAELSRQATDPTVRTVMTVLPDDASRDAEEELYAHKMQQQREELAQLTAERQKLLQMQEHLSRLQETLLETSQECLAQSPRTRLPGDGSMVMDPGAVRSGASTNVKLSPNESNPSNGRSSGLHSMSRHGIPALALPGPAAVGPSKATSVEETFSDPMVKGRRTVEPVVTGQKSAVPRANPSGMTSTAQKMLASGGKDSVTRSGEFSASMQTKASVHVAPPSVAQVTFQDPIETVMSNEELYDQMRQQRMLREELREKKRELEDMMRKENPVKQNTRNQDNQSDVVSFSNKSDQFGASTSEDQTMATWGGSTAGNLESIEENECRSDEDDEDDDDDEDMDDDNDDGRNGAAAADLANEYLRRRMMKDDLADDEGEEGASGNDGAEPIDDMLIEAARRRRQVVSSNVAFASRHDESQRNRRHKMGSNDWSSICPRVVNDVHGHLSAPAAYSQYRDERHSQDDLSTLGSLHRDVKWLRKQVLQLSRATRQSTSRDEPQGQAAVQQQLQQNQLMLNLNQSYFQLVTNQSALVERFNRLEQVVVENMGGHLSSRGTASNNSCRDSANGVSASMWSSQQQQQSQPQQQQQQNHATVSMYSRRENMTACGASQQNNNNAGLFQGGPLKLDMSSSAAAAANAEPDGDIVIETVRARDTKLQDRRQWLPAAAHRSSNNPYQSNVDQTMDDKASSVSSIQDSLLATNNEHGRNASTRADMDAQSITSNEPTAFDTMRETIYAEVATLISQNETSPHFLIELFRQLQLLSTDFLRQRALYAIQDIVTRYFAKGDDGQWQTDATNGPSLAAALTSGHGPRTTDEHSNVDRTGGLQVADAERFDYSERAESSGGSRSQSTVSDVACWDNPFAHDSLGDTVIHFDRALKKMRESANKPGTASPAGNYSGDGRMGWGTNTSVKDTEQRQHGERGAVGGWHDRGSDGSISDGAAPHIDTSQLDHEIKQIMIQIIPFIKQQMNSICSQQLLHYIQQLTLSLTRLQQLSHHQPQLALSPSSATASLTGSGSANEFTRFFHRQLDTILRDSLAKFEGRKMSECGEDLLVELSEILFNELAFFRLMQDIDGSNAKQSKAKKSIEKNPRMAASRPDDSSSSVLRESTGNKRPSFDNSRDLLSTPSPDTSSSDEQSDDDVDDSTKHTDDVDMGNNEPTIDIESSVTEAMEDDDQEKDIDETELLKQRQDISDASAMVDEDGDSSSDANDSTNKSNVDNSNDGMQGNAAATAALNSSSTSSCLNNSKLMSGRQSNFVATDDELSLHLAPSETKPLTRVGSDEDNDTGDDDDEQASADDPSETAVSRDAANNSDGDDSGKHHATGGNANNSETTVVVSDSPTVGEKELTSPSAIGNK